MRVVVSGASGFIGSALLERLPREWHVIAVSSNPDAVRGAAEVVRYGGHAAPVAEELAEPMDVLIHLAGSSSHQLAARAPWEDILATGATGAKLMHSIVAKRYVVMSSAAVYAGRTGPVGPHLSVEPTTAYALSKLYVEGLAKGLASQRSASLMVIRLFNAFGPGERPSRLVPRVARALHANAAFELTADPMSLSDPVYIDDVVGVLIAAADSHSEGTYDLCGGQPIAMLEQVHRIAESLGGSCDVVFRPDPDEVPILFHTTPDELLSSLRLGPLIPFRAAVKQYAFAEGWGT